MFCSGSTGPSGCTVGQSCNLAVHLDSTNQALLGLTCLPRSVYHEGLFCYSSVFSVFVHLTTITSVAAGKRSFGNKSSPPGLLPFAQTLPRSCSHPTVRAEVQMKAVGQVLTGFWIREGPEVLLGKQEFTGTHQSTRSSMHPSTGLGFFSDMKGNVLSAPLR